jgi:uncharacterized protein
MGKTRREFLKTGVAALATQAMAQQAGAGVPTRTLGKTGEQVSILALGGGHIGGVGGKDETLAIRMMHTAIDEGVNFFDNAWAYGEGVAETVMGKALKGGKREKVFLMTKCSGRDTKFATQCLDDSLRRLQTDRIDLWQFHEINWDNDPDWVFERGGLKVALEAKKAGKVRHIGFTGHKDPHIHAKMINKPFDWETSQMPINPMDYFYRSFARQTVPMCLVKNIGVIGMKSMGGGGMDQGVICEHTNMTPEECLRYSLSQPIATMVRGWTKMEHVMSDIKIARSFQPLSEAETARILDKAKPHAGDGRYEQSKSTQRFDNKIYREMHGFPDLG